MKFILRVLLIVLLFNKNTVAQSWVDNLKNQQKTATTVSDPQAKKILDKVSAKYKTYKSIVAAFKLKIENTKNKVNEEQSGKVYISGNKYKLEMKEQDVICDNKTIWTHLKESKEVQVNSYDPTTQGLSPSQIFTIYEKGFSYIYAGEEKDKAGNVIDIVDFTPTDKNKPFFKIKLYIDRSLSQIKMAKIMEKNGNKYTYQLNSFNTNETLSDAFFSWNATAHPGVSVVDLR